MTFFVITRLFSLMSVRHHFKDDQYNGSEASQTPITIHILKAFQKSSEHKYKDKENDKDNDKDKDTNNDKKLWASKILLEFFRNF